MHSSVWCDIYSACTVNTTIRQVTHDFLLQKLVHSQTVALWARHPWARILGLRRLVCTDIPRLLAGATKAMHELQAQYGCFVKIYHFRKVWDVKYASTRGKHCKSETKKVNSHHQRELDIFCSRWHLSKTGTHGLIFFVSGSVKCTTWLARYTTH